MLGQVRVLLGAVMGPGGSCGSPQMQVNGKQADSVSFDAQHMVLQGSLVSAAVSLTASDSVVEWSC